MLKLDVGNNIIYFRDITIEQLPIVLEWYNKVDNFKYATGLDKPISLDALRARYAEVAICSNEFFAGIYLKRPDKMIGILKGRLRYMGKSAVWISSIVIDPIYQNKGYGTQSIGLLLRHLKENKGVQNAYLAVVEENRQGRKFWLKLDFKEIRKIDEHLKLQDKYQNVIIMQKNL